MVRCPVFFSVEFARGRKNRGRKNRGRYFLCPLGSCPSASPQFTNYSKTNRSSVRQLANACSAVFLSGYVSNSLLIPVRSKRLFTFSPAPQRKNDTFEFKDLNMETIAPTPLLSINSTKLKSRITAWRSAPTFFFTYKIKAGAHIESRRFSSQLTTVYLAYCSILAIIFFLVFIGTVSKKNTFNAESSSGTRPLWN